MTTIDGFTQVARTERNIVLITSIMAQHDAISNSVVSTYKALTGNPAWKVSIFAAHNSQSEVPVKVICNVSDLLLDPAFRNADLIIYHYGIYYAHFDAIIVGNGHARQVVRFHNITPSALVGASSRDVIDRSLAQLHNLQWADRIWADSPFNKQELLARGFDARRIEVLPLVVDAPPTVTLVSKMALPLKVLFVGRMVPSKGLLDAIDVTHRVAGEFPDLRLSVIGNLSFSDRGYFDRCVARAHKLGIAHIVQFAPSADDSVLAQAYSEAHVLLLPTYHEGFCVPVVEALRAGAIPLGYRAGNMPFIVDDHGRLVAPGDVAGLAKALGELLRGLQIARGTSVDTPCLPLGNTPISVAQFDRSSKNYARQFSFEVVAKAYQARVRSLIGSDGCDDRRALRADVEIVPDDEMRERKRHSLNRIPDISDWEPGSRLTDIMRELCQPVCVHRKSWEYALCIEGLERLGKITPEAQALAVGAGSETPLFYLANRIRRMVATDLYDNPAHEGSPAMLADPTRFSPFAYREDHLQTLRMSGDNLEFADGTFDFVFALSSIEHFGSREVQRKSVDEIARVMKSGGVACIITELILTGGVHKEYFTLEELTDIFLSRENLKLVGGEWDLSISASLVDNPVDLIHSRNVSRSPHIVLQQDDLKWTSLSMFLQKQ